MELNKKQNKYKIFDFLSGDLKDKFTGMIGAFNKSKQNFFYEKIDEEEEKLRKILVEVALEKDPSLLDEMKRLGYKITFKSNFVIEEKEKSVGLEALEKKINEL